VSTSHLLDMPKGRSDPIRTGLSIVRRDAGLFSSGCCGASRFFCRNICRIVELTVVVSISFGSVRQTMRPRMVAVPRSTAVASCALWQATHHWLSSWLELRICMTYPPVIDSSIACSRSDSEIHVKQEQSCCASKTAKSAIDCSFFRAAAEPWC